MADKRPPITSDQLIDIAAGLKPAEPIKKKDRRSRRRVPYNAYVALLLVVVVSYLLMRLWNRASESTS